jgi:hypothetical protein
MWTKPKTDWKPGDGIMADDLNRMEDDININNKMRTFTCSLFWKQHTSGSGSGGTYIDTNGGQLISDEGGFVFRLDPGKSLWVRRAELQVQYNGGGGGLNNEYFLLNGASTGYNLFAKPYALTSSGNTKYIIEDNMRAIYTNATETPMVYRATYYVNISGQPALYIGVGADLVVNY